MKLGDTITDFQKDALRKEVSGTYRFIIPYNGAWKSEFGEYRFYSEDKGANWTCIKNSEGEISMDPEKSLNGYFPTPDRRRSPDFYTRYHSTSGGKPEFNPVSGTGSPRGKKTLD
jgi:hypothetical protein